MWGAQSGMLTPPHGPHQVLEGAVLQDVSRALQERFRELCFYHRKHVELGRISAHREQREDDLQQVADRFYLRSKEAVCEFLRHHRFLLNVLLEARTRIDEQFKPNDRPVLELFTDPEDDNSHAKLFALILTALPSKDASARLDRLDQDWWLRQSQEVKRAMNIDIEYVDDGI
jgi:hypothetical protein